jgi:Mannosyltransferase putative
MESGVVAFDKGHPRMVMSLLFTAWMNTKYIRDKETYVHVHAGKETYWLAAELSNTTYYFQPEYAGLIGILEPTSTSKISSAHILHMDHTGDTPFWFNGGVLLNKALGEELGTFTHFIIGGAAMSDQPAWRYDGNEYWCAEGKPAIALAEEKMDVVLG